MNPLGGGRSLGYLGLVNTGPPGGSGRAGLQARTNLGFLIDEQGYILTSDRVVNDARLIEVSLHDGRRAEDADDDFLGGRPERPGLLDLVLKCDAASGH